MKDTPRGKVESARVIRPRVSRETISLFAYRRLQLPFRKIFPPRVMGRERCNDERAHPNKALRKLYMRMSVRICVRVYVYVCACICVCAQPVPFSQFSQTRNVSALIRVYREISCARSPWRSVTLCWYYTSLEPLRVVDLFVTLKRRECVSLYISKL